VKNHQQGFFVDNDKIGLTRAMNLWVRHRSCFGCPQRCMKIGRVRRGAFKGAICEGPEFETAMNGANWMLDDINAYFACLEYAEEAGFDVISIGGVVGYALEAYEKGAITSADINGIRLEWGNGAEIIKFMKAIVEDKKDIFEWFRRGSTYAAERIGKDSWKYAVDVKNMPYAAHSTQPQQWAAMSYAVSTRGADHVHGGGAAGQHNAMIRDMGVFCLFYMYSYNTPGYVDILNFVTGNSLTIDQYRLIGEKAYNIDKLFNLREGFKAIDDQAHYVTMHVPHTLGASAGRFIPEADILQARTDFYVSRGWDPNTGIPSAGKFQELGLNAMIPYLNSITP